MKVSRRRDPMSPDPFELAERLAALEQAAVVDEPIRRISNESVSTATPPTICKPVRPWCLQRHMPLRNRAAHPVMCYGFLEATQDDCGFADNPLLQTVGRPAFTTPLSIKRSPIRAATMPLPVLDIRRSLIDNGHTWDDRMVTINAKDMLSKMWQTSNTLADSIDIPIRCKAIAKCVWREWRDFLQSSEERLFRVDELLKGLSSKFKQAVVDYGWESDWQNLPQIFIEIMEKTTRAAVEKDRSGMFRVNTS
ncbi:hypothetical protein Slin15195_G016200 [Septoria linicola]|uniref:Uncharacterized protein n=1 Tax=Septoria linicola TaxID=215465 RepID=A0A9Q9EE18_9PEZI|nr:hypothetical protein Slin14017_G016260 [Septoria linicola]USW48301.1 hypothetical protein Slin15195_G016200 [Septoria linicola]